jgi:8-oxo-dGTP pyrophosphatase MutT (NUDIX family)
VQPTNEADSEELSVNTDKINARRNGWEIVRTDYPYETQFFRLRRDELQLPNGKDGVFTYVEKTPAVFIIPVTTTGDLVLIRQFRYINDRWSWEIPAGGSHDFDDVGQTVSLSGDEDTPNAFEDLARRELSEEIGGTAESWQYLGVFYGASGVLSQTFHIYLAEGVQLADQNLEDTEVIEVHAMPLDRALALMRSGEGDAFDAYVLMRYETLLREVTARARAQHNGGGA